MVRFGLHVVGFGVVYSLAKAVDRIGLGLFYRPEVVGYYQNATVLYEYSILLALARLSRSEAHRSANFNLILLLSGRNTKRRYLC